MSTATIHITPSETGAWLLEGEDPTGNLDGPLATYPTEAQAVATAYEMLQGSDLATVLVHAPDGRVRRSLVLHLGSPNGLDGEDLALRAKALEMLPTFDRLKAGIGKHPVPPGDFDNEEMAC
jgi:hypothetical protein